nr:glycosyltransferase [uncultured Butyrivibrio sp.]
MGKYRIQTIVFPKDTKHMLCKDLFYKGDRGYLDRTNSVLTLGVGQTCDLTTYLNSCSWAKWKKYTNANGLTIYLDIEGDCELTFVGYSLEYQEVARQEFGVITIHNNPREMVSFTYPDNECTIVGVEITAIGKCVIYSGFYEASYEGTLNDIHLSIATTTCYKEEFIKKNIKLIKDEIINGDDEIKNNITVHVVDNGRTLSDEEIVSEHILLHPNPNTGGSGGFARGMLESLHQETPATHVILMDDDVLILPESLKRTYHLLRMLKDEYKSYFISGAMIKYEQPNKQHEDIGSVRGGGQFIALKPNMELNELEDVVKNDGAYYNASNQYAGWWYCCIPIEEIKKNGLPLPLFIRCDDSEYSLRARANILTMNGICIWHMGFKIKYNAAMDIYMQVRNMHIARAASGVLKDLDIHTDYNREFFRKLYKFEYGACELVLQGVEDYLKGPDFIKSCDGEALLKEKRAYNEKLIPLEDNKAIQIRDIKDVFEDENRKIVDKLIFHMTKNGHVLSPSFIYKHPGVITTAAYGFSIQTQNITRKTEYAAVDPYSETFVIRKLDKRRGQDLLKRFKKLEKEYKRRHLEVEQAYRKAQPYLTSEEFWKEYLKLEK